MENLEQAQERLNNRDFRNELKDNYEKMEKVFVMCCWFNNKSIRDFNKDG